MIAVNQTGDAAHSYTTLLKQIQAEVLPSPNAPYGLKALLAGHLASAVAETEH